MEALSICAVGLEILKFEQTLLVYSASYFKWGGGWSFVSEELSPPWQQDCVAKLQLAI